VKERDLVKVWWMDSRGATSSWSRVEDINEGVCEMVSVGYLLKEHDDHIVIAPHISTGDDQQACGVMYIPLCAIIKREALP